jgi:hypothetical protein
VSAGGWYIDFTAWPRSLDIRTARAAEWVAPSAAPGGFAELVTLDLDRRGRCVGFEVWNRAVLGDVPASTAVQSMLQPAPLDGASHRALERWLRSVRVIAGPGDPHASVHWARRRAYDVSAELADSELDADAWIRLGVRADDRLAALRFMDPTRHVRGLG